MVKVKVVETGRHIAPFGDRPGAVPILNRPLSAWQAEAFVGAGLEVDEAPTGPHLELPDTLFTTAEALTRFLEGAGGRNAVLVLKESIFAQRAMMVQPGLEKVEGGWRFPSVRFVSGGDEPFADVLLDPEEIPVHIPTPAYYVGRDAMSLGLTRAPVMPIQHWAHIVWANQAAMAVEALRIPRWRWTARFLWGALRALSLNKWRVLSKMNTVGRKCDIHPTAVVEMSTLGDNVVVGPHARVRFSRLGDGVMLMGGAQAEFSVLGDKAIVGNGSSVNYCVLYPGAVANQRVMQLCVLGREAVTTEGSYSIDLNFDRDIRVKLDGQLHDTGQRTLGSAVGHGARLGTGFWLASGRAIPNHAFLIRDPEQVISRFPEDGDVSSPWIPHRGGVRRLDGEE